jgi:hypothetical protein
MGAQLVVEGTNGTSVPLYDAAGNGQYTAVQLNLKATEKYRLRIITSDGTEYASDYVAVLKNPPIDSISWKRDTAGVTVFVSTHNPENNTRYYRWEFDETWENKSVYPFVPIPGVVENDGIMEPLGPGESLYNCWKYYNSSNLVLATTTQLSSDVVFEKPLIDIPDGNDKLSERYTVLVRQFALDKQGYDFYQLMKKNTESLGSIFDAQPTEIRGNVRPVSNSEARVIGYITASSVDSSRIWIENNEVPGWKPWADCTQSIKINTRTDNLKEYVGDWLPYSADMNGNVYLGRRECVSCRLRGGSTQKPTFW